ncbi:MAG: hypothetical protein H7259_02495, partial [Cytophagales bacterium]|nr:hypothetical protein [Cytophaga sp.]
MIHHYNIKKVGNPSFISCLISIVLIAAGVFIFIHNIFVEHNSSVLNTLFVCSGIITSGVILFSSHEGTSLDFKGMRYMDYYSCCGFKSGKWETLPAITAINLIAQQNEEFHIYPNTSGNSPSYKSFLYANNMNPAFVFN